MVGAMDPTKGVSPASGTVFARQSNMDAASGAIIPPDVVAWLTRKITINGTPIELLNQCHLYVQF
jgi:hypothetical protein